MLRCNAEPKTKLAVTVGGVALLVAGTELTFFKWTVHT